MKQGDFLVFRTNGWAARWIQLFTRSRWNHAAIYIGDGRIVEAEPTGVRITNLHEAYTDDQWIVSGKTLTSWQRNKIVTWAKSKEGTPYGWLDIAALGLLSLGIRWKWLDRFAADQSRLVCSQLVSYAYFNAGIPLTNDDAWTVTPGDLEELIVEAEAK